MFNEENEPKKKQPFQIGQDLSDLSVGDLEEVIVELRKEITRLEGDIAAKQSTKSAADALFK